MLRTLLEIPLVWFLAGLAAAWVLQRRPAWAGMLAAVDGAACVAIFSIVATLNVFTAGFLVSFGANVLAIAAAHAHGQPMYHAPGQPLLYTLVYGPFTYLVYEPLLTGMHALFAVKLELLALDVVTLGSVFALMRRHASWHAALILTGLGAAMLLAVPAGVLGIRGDLWGVAALTLALLGIEAGNWIVASLLVGLCCGFAVDVKATLLLEAALLLTMLWCRHGYKAALAGALAAAATIAAPFLTTNISWTNYVAWLRLSGHRESFPALFVANTLYAVMLLLPAALLWKVKRVSVNPEVILFALATLAAILLGAKSGGGPWHLWPLLPFVLAWTARRADQNRKVLSAVAMAALLVSARWGIRAVRIELPGATQAARATQQAELTELASVMKANPGVRIELAPGAEMRSDADDLRYFLVTYGQPYAVDMVAAGEALKTDPALLNPLLTVASDCSTLWAVPTGEVPFSTVNNGENRKSYPQLFPPAVRAAFLQGHSLAHQGPYYDLWARTSTQRQSTACE